MRGNPLARLLFRSLTQQVEIHHHQGFLSRALSLQLRSFVLMKKKRKLFAQIAFASTDGRRLLLGRANVRSLQLIYSVWGMFKGAWRRRCARKQTDNKLWLRRRRNPRSLTPSHGPRPRSGKAHLGGKDHSIIASMLDANIKSLLCSICGGSFPFHWRLGRLSLPP